MSSVRAGAVTAILIGVAAGGCSDTTSPPPLGEVHGIVVVDGVGLPGVEIELSGGGRRQASTDGSGRYNFPGVASGAYVVTILDAPTDVSFSATSKTAVIGREPGRLTETVDFNGSYIRTSAITGRVTARGRPVANVAVRIEGPDTVAAFSDSDGRYTASGLRRGVYGVTISGFPNLVTFPSTEAEIEVGTGAVGTVDFAGDRELTATVVIQTITTTDSSGNVATVDPFDVRGRIDVQVAVDRGQDTPEAVDLYLGDELVGRQVFNAEGSPVAGSVGARVLSDPEAATLQLAFTIDTRFHDLQTGAPRFLNGPTPLEARLATWEGGENVWTSFVSLTLRNRNTFIGRLEPGWGPLSRSDGRLWVGGDLEVLVTPVLYDEGLEIQSITVELRRVGGATLREQSLDGEGPLIALFPGSGEPDSGNIVGYDTPEGLSDEFRVRVATFSDGSALPAPVVIVDEVHIASSPPSGEAALSLDR